jgi:hypothetical protein
MKKYWAGEIRHTHAESDLKMNETSTDFVKFKIEKKSSLIRSSQWKIYVYIMRVRHSMPSTQFNGMILSIDFNYNIIKIK